MIVNLSGDIYEQLSLRILGWEYPPSHRLTEEGLCAEFQVSRSPVREALNMLVERGLVRKNARQGYTVRDLDLQEIKDSYDVRLVLELDVVARLCRAGVDGAVLDRMEARWTQLRDGLPALSPKAAEEDEGFHRELAEATGNRVLVRALGAIDSHIHFVRRSDITNTERLRQTCVDHLEIIAALRQKDLATVSVALRRNIEWGKTNVEAAIKDALVRAHLGR
ncbi:MAG: GntR family transcriptional regulator [Spirochaetales bacterium]